MANKITIILDSEEGHVVAVFTNDPTLEVELVDIDTSLDYEPVIGPQERNDLIIPVMNVNDTVVQYIKERVPDWNPNEVVEG